MASNSPLDLSNRIVQRACALGASLAGITSVASLARSPSHGVLGKTQWPEKSKSVLVLALAHHEAEPDLDWWRARQGGTCGDIKLAGIAKDIMKWLHKELNILAWLMPYYVGEGDLFLKDAGALAGLGVIGANNLLVTPEFGPRIRLRALSLDAVLDQGRQADFHPCDSCDRPCWRSCPQRAFVDGVYKRDICSRQMKENEDQIMTDGKVGRADSTDAYIAYCRCCELACPVGK